MAPLRRNYWPPRLESWKGIPAEELTKEQLLEIISHQQKEIITLKRKLKDQFWRFE